MKFQRFLEEAISFLKEILGRFVEKFQQTGKHRLSQGVKGTELGTFGIYEFFQ